MNDEEFEEWMARGREKAAARRAWLDAMEIELQTMEAQSARVRLLVEQVRREL